MYNCCMSTFTKLKTIIIDKVKTVDEVKIIPEADFRLDLGCGDLDLIEIFMRVEDEFDITLCDDYTDNLQIGTVSELVEQINSCD